MRTHRHARDDKVASLKGNSKAFSMIGLIKSFIGQQYDFYDGVAGILQVCTVEGLFSLLMSILLFIHMSALCRSRYERGYIKFSVQNRRMADC